MKDDSHSGILSLCCSFKSQEILRNLANIAEVGRLDEERISNLPLNFNLPFLSDQFQANLVCLIKQTAWLSAKSELCS